MIPSSSPSMSSPNWNLIAVAYFYHSLSTREYSTCQYLTIDQHEIHPISSISSSWIINVHIFLILDCSCLYVEYSRIQNNKNFPSEGILIYHPLFNGLQPKNSSGYYLETLSRNYPKTPLGYNPEMCHQDTTWKYHWATTQEHHRATG